MTIYWQAVYLDKAIALNKHKYLSKYLYGLHKTFL